MAPRKDRMKKFREKTTGELQAPIGEALERTPIMGFQPLMPSRDAALSTAVSPRPEQETGGYGPWMGSLGMGPRAAAAVAASDPKFDADVSIQGDRGGVDPRGQGNSQRLDPGSTDKPLPKQGTGQEATMDRGVAARDIEQSTAGRVRAVKKADGTMVFTNLPDEEVTSPTRVGEVGGSAGQAFVQPGGEMEAAAAIPDARGDRSPGWALRQVLNKQHAAGTLSMDPQDIEDRQRYEAQDEEKEIQKAVMRARAEQAISPTSEAGVGEEIEQSNIQERVRQAREAYGEMTEQINAYYQLPPSPQRDEIIDRLELERREVANLLQGFALKDPRQPDAMAAMFAAALGGGGGGGAPPGGDH